MPFGVEPRERVFSLHQRCSSVKKFFPPLTFRKSMSHARIEFHSQEFVWREFFFVLVSPPAKNTQAKK
jgi:hypothetical protein